jgi:pyruvate kinase
MSKPVIIATQMMESMITSFMPTRAEANDVANAVLDGADALMLSGETSVGQHPIQVVEYMTKIIVNVEEGADIYYRNAHLDKNSPSYLSDSLCYTAVKTAKHIDAKAIVGMTKSGYTAFKVCSFRPSAKVFIFTPDRQLMARLALVWGVETFFYNKLTSTDETIQDVLKILLKQGELNFGDVVINTGSMPIQQKLRANMMKISIVD